MIIYSVQQPIVELPLWLCNFGLRSVDEIHLLNFASAALERRIESLIGLVKRAHTHTCCRRKNRNEATHLFCRRLCFAFTGMYVFAAR